MTEKIAKMIISELLDEIEEEHMGMKDTIIEHINEKYNVDLSLFIADAEKN